MKSRRLHDGLYLANATILLTHQIDAAYWHEWTLFGMPGGVQLFLLLNLPILFLILHGTTALALGLGSGVVISWVVVCCGLFAFGFHSFHLLRGDEAFTLPVSLGLLAATLVLSVAQAASLLVLRRDSGGGASGLGKGQRTRSEGP